MRAGKKESIGVLIGAMAEAESKSFYDDTEAVTSDLKSLLNIFLKKDSSSERVQILKDYESGAPAADQTSSESLSPAQTESTAATEQETIVTEVSAETQTQEETAKAPKYVFCLLVMV